MVPLFVFAAGLVAVASPRVPHDVHGVPVWAIWSLGLVCWSLSVVGGDATTRAIERRMRKTGGSRPLRRLPVWMLGWRVVALAGLAVVSVLDGPSAATGSPTLAAFGLWVVLPLVLCWGVLVLHCVSEARIDRLLEEGRSLGAWIDGEPAEHPRSRARLASILVRSEVLLYAAPLGVLLVAAEGIERAARAMQIEAPGAVIACQIGGVFALSLFSPFLISTVLPTRRVDDEPLGRQVGDVARTSGVKLWRVAEMETLRGQINAAVVGPAWWRLVLLTDGARTELTEAELLAVSAHEVGHLARRHLVWLMLSVVGPAGLAAAGMHHAAAALGLDADSEWLIGLQGAAVMALVLTVLGFVSRRFEREADASAVVFAARRAGAERIGPEHVVPLRTSLGLVCRLGCLSPNRWTWRHGSVRGRLESADRLVGSPASTERSPRGGGVWRLGIALAALGGAAAAWLTDWPV